MQDPEIVPIPSSQANRLKWTGLPTIPPRESQVQKMQLLLPPFSKETPICSSRTCPHPQSCYLLSHLRDNGCDSRKPCPGFLLPSYPDLPLPLTIEISPLAESLPAQRLTPCSTPLPETGGWCPNVSSGVNFSPEFSLMFPVAWAPPLHLDVLTTEMHQKLNSLWQQQTNPHTHQEFELSQVAFTPILHPLSHLNHTPNPERKAREAVLFSFHRRGNWGLRTV